MSHQKPTGDSGQGAKKEPDPRQSGDSPKPHGDKLGHAVEEAAGKPPKQRG
jgi:hypothetical protein